MRTLGNDRTEHINDMEIGRENFDAHMSMRLRQPFWFSLCFCFCLMRSRLRRIRIVRTPRKVLYRMRKSLIQQELRVRI